MTSSELKIVHFIKHFVYAHNELCLAGIGRFVCEEVEYIVDPVAKLISPCMKKVNFSQGDFITSPAFIDFLSAHSEINDVSEKLESFPMALKASILPGKRLEIDGFGYFKFNVLGELDFEPLREVSIEKASFGLKPIHFAANLVKVKRLEVSTEEEEDEALVQMRESALKELKVMLDQAKITESSTVKKSNNLFPLIATALTLILLVNLGLFLYSGPIDNIKSQVAKMDIFGQTGEVIEKSVRETLNTAKPAKSEALLVPAITTINYLDLTNHIGLSLQRDSFYFDSTSYTEPILVQADSVTKNSEVILNNNEAVSPLESEVLPTATSISIEDTEMEVIKANAEHNLIPKGFYVIAGAFKGEDNAANLVQSLRSNGYKESVTVKPETYPFHLAAFARKSKMGQAQKLADKLKADGKTVWIYAAY